MDIFLLMCLKWLVIAVNKGVGLNDLLCYFGYYSITWTTQFNLLN